MLPRSAFRPFAILTFAAASALITLDAQAYLSPGPDLGSSCAWEGADPTRAGFFATCVSSVVVARPLQAGNQTAACDATTAGQIKYSSGALSFCNGSAWTSVSSGGSSQWSDGASSAIYYNSGNVGIGTTSPGSALDVKGTLRLSGSTSGHVGLAPAAAAGSTTYTLPSSDGSSGQVLSTNGGGTLNWATVSSGGADPGTLCGLAQQQYGYNGEGYGCLSFVSVFPCNGSSIVSSCPSGYTLRTFTPTGAASMCSIRTCSKN